MDTNSSSFYRSRSSYDISSIPYTSRQYPYDCADRHWHTVGSGVMGCVGTKMVMGDYVIPRFHARSRAGEKFFNPLVSEVVTVSDSVSSFQVTSLSDFCIGGPKASSRDDGALIAVFTPRSPANDQGHQLPYLQASIMESAVTRLQTEVSTEVLAKRGTGTAETWESVAEYRQTLDLLHNPLTRLKDLSRRILSSAERSRTSLSLLKEVSDGYLLYRYGISPLMKDIQQIVASLDKGSGSTEEVSSRAFGELNSSSSIQGTTINGPYTAYWTCQIDDIVSVRGMALDRGHISLANAFGLNAKGLMLLPLQLTSYSFVADWFTNLSSYVAATLPTLGWTSLGNCLVTKRVTSSIYSLSNIISSDTQNPVSIVPNGTALINRRSTTRTGLHNAGFAVNRDFKFDSFTRSADALALIASRFVKLKTLIGPRPNNSAFHDRKAYHVWSNQPDVR